MLRDESRWIRQGYSAGWWDTLNRDQRVAFLSKLTEVEVEEFFHDWRVWAHDYQIPPDASDPVWGEWTTWLFLAGRGSGKTRSAVEFITDEVNKAAKLGIRLRIAIVGQGADDVRTVMVEGESGFLACAAPTNMPVFRPSVGGGTLIWPSGSRAWIYSAVDTEALRGPQFHIGWFDEPMAVPRGQRERAIDNLEFCLRLGPCPKLILTTTPKKDLWLKQMERDAKDPANGIHISRASTYANQRNLPASFLKKIERKYGGTRLGRQEILGEILGEEEGALWNEDKIEKNRTPELDPILHVEQCAKVVIGVDPNTRDKNGKALKVAHAAGIVVVGANGRERYVLADRTVKGGPAIWSKAAIKAAREFDADEIAVEVNQGGDMVKMVLGQAMAEADFHIPIHVKWAKKSKEGRAEPVANMYDLGFVHHCGDALALETLETQMCYIHEESDPTGEDFDRVDALVWAMTRLGLKKRAVSAGSASTGGIRTFEEFDHGSANQSSGGGHADDWVGA